MGVMEQQVASRTPLVALLGNPNCGKTALFNRLTGARQKVANYAGVTIERKEGSFTSPGGRALRVLDLPGGPVAVKVGESTFALRKFEAALISIQPE